MTTNPRRSLANQSNALKSTGPRSVAGKRASSQNSRKHGLNSAPDFESSIEYRALVDLIAGEGFSTFACADIAAAISAQAKVENPSPAIRSTSARYSMDDSKSGALFRPCLREFWLLALFPATDLGPVDLSALL